VSRSCQGGRYGLPFQASIVVQIMPSPPPRPPGLSGQDPDKDQRSIPFGLIRGYCDTTNCTCHLSEMIVHRFSTVYVKEIIFSRGKPLGILGVKNKIVLRRPLRIYNLRKRLLILLFICSILDAVRQKNRTFAVLFHRTECISFASTGAYTNFMDRAQNKLVPGRICTVQYESESRISKIKGKVELALDIRCYSFANLNFALEVSKK
jgi:hypothetical protein